MESKKITISREMIEERRKRKEELANLKRLKSKRIFR